MDEKNQDSPKIKNKWLRKGAKVIAILAVVYIALFAIRFAQVNFYGKHRLFTTQVPETLHNGYIDSSWEGHFLPEDWKKLQVTMQFVDLNGDFKSDFILYAREMVYVVKPAPNGKWEITASADCVNKFLYLPFTIWGNPIILRLDKPCNNISLFEKMS